MLTLILIITSINLFILLKVLINNYKSEQLIKIRNEELKSDSYKRREGISKDISAINYNYKKVLEFMNK